jgi:hypothetical protein
MGWRIHRVWSTEWFHDHDRAIAGILRSVEQAKQMPMDRPIYAPTTNPAPLPPNRSPVGETHRAQEIQRRYKPGVQYTLFKPRQRLSRDHLLNADHSTILAETICQLVHVEGPIHHDLLVDRLKELHEVARAGSNVQSNIDRALRSALQGRRVTRESRSSFYFVSGHELKSFRLPPNSAKRPIEQIAPKEIALAVLYLVEDQFGIFEESLPAAVARLFGIDRVRAESAAMIESVIEDLVTQSLLRRNGIQVHLA